MKIRGMDALDLASSEQDLDRIFTIFSKQMSISVEPWFYSTPASTQSTEAAWGACLGVQAALLTHMLRGATRHRSTSLAKGLIEQSWSVST